MRSGIQNIIEEYCKFLFQEYMTLNFAIRSTATAPQSGTWFIGCSCTFWAHRAEESPGLPFDPSQLQHDSSLIALDTQPCWRRALEVSYMRIYVFGLLVLAAMHGHSPGTVSMRNGNNVMPLPNTKLLE